MANSNAPFGLRPVKHLSGGVISPNKLGYTIASGYGTDLFMGDPVDVSGTSVNGKPGIVRATAGDTNKILGVFAGCSYVNASGQPVWSQYWPASTTATNIEAFVYDDPNILFEIQADATGIAAVDIGLNVNLESGSGSTTTFLSGFLADGSGTPATTATYQLRLRGFSEDPLNEVGAYAKVLVSINNHRNANAVVGA